MFRKLGMKLDNLIAEIVFNIRKWNQRKFWYKFYAYVWASRQIPKKGTYPLTIIDNLLEWELLYDWQVKKLVTKFAKWNIK